MSALFTQCTGDTIQTGTGKVDQARKFKCTTAARANYRHEGEGEMYVTQWDNFSTSKVGASLILILNTRMIKENLSCKALI